MSVTLVFLEGLTTDEMLEKQPKVYASFCADGPEYVHPVEKASVNLPTDVFWLLKLWQIGIPGKRSLRLPTVGFLGAVFRKVLNIGLDTERNFLLLNCSINRIQKAENKWQSS